MEDLIRGLPAGTRIPSEHELVTRFDVPRSLVRSAIAQLEARFVVRRVQGSGTFVHQRLDYVISSGQPPSFQQTVHEAGGVARTILVGSESQPAPQLARPLLALEGHDAERPLQHLKRLSHIDDRPVSYLEEWFLDDVIPHADVAVNAFGSVNVTLRGLGFEPRRAWCRVSVDVPPDHARDHLELESHQITWVVESLAADARTGRPLFFSKAWTRQDAIRMVFELDAS